MIIRLKNKDTLIVDQFRFKCCIGKNGLKKNKVEGDYSTPKGKFLLDLRNSAIKQLQRARISKSQITINPYCTFKDDELFHSWRRDKVKSSNWSCIISN